MPIPRYRLPKINKSKRKRLKVKINCLAALTIRRVQNEILSRAELLIQIFHDCVDVAESLAELAQPGEIDYRVKLRDLCCSNLEALSYTENVVVHQLLKNRQAKLKPFFTEYVSQHGLAKLDGLSNNCTKSVLHTIISNSEESNNNAN